MIDPLRQEQRRRRVVLGIGGPAVLGVAAWALWPLGDAEIPTIAGPTPTSAASSAMPFDADAYLHVKLAPEPPPKPKPEPDSQAAKTAASTLALVAIVDVDGGRRAALFDAAENRLRVVGVGDSFSGVKVGEIRANGLDLDAGGSTVRLELKDGPRSSSGKSP